MSFCKANGFNGNFFDETFFTDQENGLETFFKNYYNNWISELDRNQRGFSPFNLNIRHDLDSLVKQYTKSKHFLDAIIHRPSDTSDVINRVAATTTDREIRLMSNHSHCQYLTMCWKGINEFIHTQIKIQENGKP